METIIELYSRLSDRTATRDGGLMCRRASLRAAALLAINASRSFRCCSSSPTICNFFSSGNGCPRCRFIATSNCCAHTTDEHRSSFLLALHNKQQVRANVFIFSSTITLYLFFIYSLFFFCQLHNNRLLVEITINQNKGSHASVLFLRISVHFQTKTTIIYSGTIL
jgi:hypothetical protein